jgi:glycosyltransferase involved in cell wall biosynthesis
VDRSRVDLQFQLMEHKNLGLPLRTKILRCESYAKLWFYERRIARRAKLQVVCGPDDEVFVRRYIARRAPVKVVGNGVDLEFFRPDAVDTPRAAEPTLIFCGAMDYSPNIDALRWWFGGVHERVAARVPGLRVLIVGKSPTAEVQAFSKNPGVVVTGTVPDVRPYYREAWAQIVPLRIGGGTRLKIPESMATGTPVVSTTIGAQGLDLVHGRDVLLGDTVEEFAHETVRMLTDAALRRSVTENGLATATARFSWQRRGREFCNAFANQGTP